MRNIFVYSRKSFYCWRCNTSTFADLPHATGVTHPRGCIAL